MSEYRLIPLYGKHGKGKFAKVSPQDYEKLSQFRWVYAPSGGYAIRQPCIDGKQVCILMHRLILNPSQEMKVDHIDGDGLNNQIGNLRIATHAENMRNRKKSAPATSKYKGVWFETERRDTFKTRLNPWRAAIRLNGKKYYLGSYGTPKEAAQAYNLAAIELHGPFAKLNQI